MVLNAFSGRHVAGALLAAILISSAVSRPGEARRMRQCGVCGNLIQNVTGPTVTPLLDYTGVCTLDGAPTLGRLSDDSWVQMSTSNTLAQGAQAVLTGRCLQRGCSGTNCVTFTDLPRNINVVPLSYYDPNMNPPPTNYLLAFKAGVTSRQSIDSTDSVTTSGPIGRKPNIEGLWTYRFWAVSTATACSIQPTVHPEETLTINVDVCKPEWYVDGGVNIHPGPGAITIAVPSDMGDILIPLASAVGDWEVKTGRSIHIDFGGSCAVSPPDPLCVRLDDSYAGPAGTCAVTGGGSYNALTGEWTSSPLINFRAAWTTTDPSVLQKDLAHELGHYFGLGNRFHSSCSCTDTVMTASYGSVCNSTAAPPAGCTLGPTTKDQRLLTNASNREVCGW
jgi:hypothetical protein